MPDEIPRDAHAIIIGAINVEPLRLTTSIMSEGRQSPFSRNKTRKNAHKEGGIQTLGHDCCSFDCAAL